jgi:uncharacterized protein
MLLIAGLSAGFLAGLLGVGGGILLVPVLRFLAPSLGLEGSHSFHIIVATSMAVVVPTALHSARAHAKRGSVDWHLFKYWAPSLAVGAFGASFAGGWLSTLALSLVFASVASLLGVRFLTAPSANMAAVLPVEPSKQLAKPTQVSLGILIGAIAAWMGIGGGTLLVPTFQALRMGMHKAVGTSAALGFIVATPALIGWIISGWSSTNLAQGQLGFVNVYVLLIILPCALFAAPFGVRVAHTLPDFGLKCAFGCFLIAASALILIKALH